MYAAGDQISPRRSQRIRSPNEMTSSLSEVVDILGSPYSEHVLYMKYVAGMSGPLSLTPLPDWVIEGGEPPSAHHNYTVSSSDAFSDISAINDDLLEIPPPKLDDFDSPPHNFLLDKVLLKCEKGEFKNRLAIQKNQLSNFHEVRKWFAVVGRRLTSDSGMEMLMKNEFKRRLTINEEEMMKYQEISLSETRSEGSVLDLGGGDLQSTLSFPHDDYTSNAEVVVSSFSSVGVHQASRLHETLAATIHSSFTKNHFKTLRQELLSRLQLSFTFITTTQLIERVRMKQLLLIKVTEPQSRRNIQKQEHVTSHKAAVNFLLAREALLRSQVSHSRNSWFINITLNQISEIFEPLARKRLLHEGISSYSIPMVSFGLLEECQSREAIQKRQWLGFLNLIRQRLQTVSEPCSRRTVLLNEKMELSQLQVQIMCSQENTYRVHIHHQDVFLRKRLRALLLSSLSEPIARIGVVRERVASFFEIAFLKLMEAEDFQRNKIAENEKNDFSKHRAYGRGLQTVVSTERELQNRQLFIRLQQLSDSEGLARREIEDEKHKEHRKLNGVIQIVILRCRISQIEALESAERIEITNNQFCDFDHLKQATDVDIQLLQSIIALMANATLQILNSENDERLSITQDEDYHFNEIHAQYISSFSQLPSLLSLVTSSLLNNENSERQLILQEEMFHFQRIPQLRLHKAPDLHVGGDQNELKLHPADGFPQSPTDSVSEDVIRSQVVACESLLSSLRNAILVSDNKSALFEQISECEAILADLQEVERSNMETIADNNKSDIKQSNVVKEVTSHQSKIDDIIKKESPTIPDLESRLSKLKAAAAALRNESMPSSGKTSTGSQDTEIDRGELQQVGTVPVNSIGQQIAECEHMLQDLRQTKEGHKQLSNGEDVNQTADDSLLQDHVAECENLLLKLQKVENDIRVIEATVTVSDIKNNLIDNHDNVRESAFQAISGLKESPSPSLSQLRYPPTEAVLAKIADYERLIDELQKVEEDALVVEAAVALQDIKDTVEVNHNQVRDVVEEKMKSFEKDETQSTRRDTTSQSSTDIQDRIDQLTARLAQLPESRSPSSETEERTKRLAELTTKLSDLKDAIPPSRSQSAEARDRIQKLSSRLSTLRSPQSVHSPSSPLESTIGITQSRVNPIEERHQINEQHVADVRLKISDLTNKLNELQAIERETYEIERNQSAPDTRTMIDQLTEKLNELRSVEEGSRSPVGVQNNEVSDTIIEFERETDASTSASDTRKEVMRLTEKLCELRALEMKASEIQNRNQTPARTEKHEELPIQSEQHAADIQQKIADLTNKLNEFRAIERETYEIERNQSAPDTRTMIDQLTEKLNELRSVEEGSRSPVGARNSEVSKPQEAEKESSQSEVQLKIKVLTEKLNELRAVEEESHRIEERHVADVRLKISDLTNKLNELQAIERETYEIERNQSAPDTRKMIDQLTEKLNELRTRSDSGRKSNSNHDQHDITSSPQQGTVHQLNELTDALKAIEGSTSIPEPDKNKIIKLISNLVTHFPSSGSVPREPPQQEVNQSDTSMSEIITISECITKAKENGQLSDEEAAELEHAVCELEEIWSAADKLQQAVRSETDPQTKHQLQAEVSQLNKTIRDIVCKVTSEIAVGNNSQPSPSQEADSEQHLTAVRQLESAVLQLSQQMSGQRQLTEGNNYQMSIERLATGLDFLRADPSGRSDTRLTAIEYELERLQTALSADSELLPKHSSQPPSQPPSRQQSGDTGMADFKRSDAQDFSKMRPSSPDDLSTTLSTTQTELKQLEDTLIELKKQISIQDSDGMEGSLSCPTSEDVKQSDHIPQNFIKQTSNDTLQESVRRLKNEIGHLTENSHLRDYRSFSDLLKHVTESKPQEKSVDVLKQVSEQSLAGKLQHNIAGIESKLSKLRSAPPLQNSGLEHQLEGTLSLLKNQLSGQTLASKLQLNISEIEGKLLQLRSRASPKQNRDLEELVSSLSGLRKQMSGESEDRESNIQTTTTGIDSDLVRLRSVESSDTERQLENTLLDLKKLKSDSQVTRELLSEIAGLKESRGSTHPSLSATLEKQLSLLYSQSDRTAEQNSEIEQLEQSLKFVRSAGKRYQSDSSESTSLAASITACEKQLMSLYSAVNRSPEQNTELEQLEQSLKLLRSVTQRSESSDSTSLTASVEKQLLVLYSAVNRTPEQNSSIERLELSLKSLRAQEESQREEAATTTAQIQTNDLVTKLTEQLKAMSSTEGDPISEPGNGIGQDLEITKCELRLSELYKADRNVDVQIEITKCEEELKALRQEQQSAQTVADRISACEQQLRELYQSTDRGPPITTGIVECENTLRSLRSLKGLSSPPTSPTADVVDDISHCEMILSSLYSTNDGSAEMFRRIRNHEKKLMSLREKDDTFNTFKEMIEFADLQETQKTTRETRETCDRGDSPIPPEYLPVVDGNNHPVIDDHCSGDFEYETEEEIFEWELPNHSSDGGIKTPPSGPSDFPASDTPLGGSINSVPNVIKTPPASPSRIRYGEGAPSPGTDSTGNETVASQQVTEPVGSPSPDAVDQNPAANIDEKQPYGNIETIPSTDRIISPKSTPTPPPSYPLTVVDDHTSTSIDAHSNRDNNNPYSVITYSPPSGPSPRRLQTPPTTIPSQSTPKVGIDLTIWQPVPSEDKDTQQPASHHIVQTPSAGEYHNKDKEPHEDNKKPDPLHKSQQWDHRQQQIDSTEIMTSQDRSKGVSEGTSSKNQQVAGSTSDSIYGRDHSNTMDKNNTLIEVEEPIRPHPSTSQIPKRERDGVVNEDSSNKPTSAVDRSKTDAWLNQMPVVDMIQTNTLHPMTSDVAVTDSLLVSVPKRHQYQPGSLSDSERVYYLEEELQITKERLLNAQQFAERQHQGTKYLQNEYFEYRKLVSSTERLTNQSEKANADGTNKGSEEEISKLEHNLSDNDIIDCLPATPIQSSPQMVDPNLCHDTPLTASPPIRKAEISRTQLLQSRVWSSLEAEQRITNLGNQMLETSRRSNTSFTSIPSNDHSQVLSHQWTSERTPIRQNSTQDYKSPIYFPRDGSVKEKYLHHTIQRIETEAHLRDTSFSPTEGSLYRRHSSKASIERSRSEVVNRSPNKFPEYNGIDATPQRTTHSERSPSPVGQQSPLTADDIKETLLTLAKGKKIINSAKQTLYRERQQSTVIVSLESDLHRLSSSLLGVSAAKNQENDSLRMQLEAVAAERDAYQTENFMLRGEECHLKRQVASQERENDHLVRQIREATDAHDRFREQFLSTPEVDDLPEGPISSWELFHLGEG
eukprot:TRINITY_DN784_c0_g1_i3.p1 TRINITY_DN784_c0_g1~~TRINITY_DN784_c0_g1_i3.p1  ORF type:complete len:3278 (+),score=757.65 TRINITY_DN784_c0_g1_i3:69-9902(+)